MKKIQRIGLVRLLNIRVILNDNQIIYEGMSEDAPDEIRQMFYSKVEGSNPFTFYVYDYEV